MESLTFLSHKCHLKVQNIFLAFAVIRDALFDKRSVALWILRTSLAQFDLKISLGGQSHDNDSEGWQKP